MTVVLIVVLVLLAIVAAVTTVWSLRWDLRVYREWKREHTEPQPRHQRRQRKRAAAQEEEDEKRWRRHLLALQCAGFGLVGGVAALTAGFVTRTPWLMVGGGNLVFLGIVAWAAYQVVLPKPTALRQKKLPGWMRSKSADKSA